MTARCAWWVAVSLWLAYCLNFADRQVVFSIFPVLRSDLSFTEAQLGLTSSLFLWVYALCSTFAGAVGDRVSKRWTVVVSLILWSGVTVLTGAAQVAWWLLACRALIGVTESLFYPSAAALVADTHGPKTRSRAMALFNAGSVIGSVGGGWFGGFMAERFHWRWAFYSLGIAGIAYALPLGLFLRRVPETSSGERPGSLPFRAALTTFLQTPSYLLLAAIYSVFTFSVYLLYTWLPSFLTQKFTLGLADAGFTAAAYLNVASLCGLALGGWAADRLQRYTRASRLWVLVAALGAAAPSIHMVGAAASLEVTIAASAAFGLSNGLFVSNMFASVFEVVSPAARATAAGFLNLIGGSVAGFAGLLGGVLADSVGVGGLMSACAVACLIAAAVLSLGIASYFKVDYLRSMPQPD